VARVVGSGNAAPTLSCRGYRDLEHRQRRLSHKLLGDFESDMLVLADRGFYSYELWTDALETGAALVFRASANMKISRLWM